jgi:hypothetical protein
VHSDIVHIELRSVPDCPNLDPVRTALLMALVDLGLSAEVTEVVGDYPSPSVLIDGVDVMTGTSGVDTVACRLDLPTIEHLRVALNAAMSTPVEPRQLATPDRCTAPSDAIRPDRPHRAAQLPAATRQVYQAILRHFAATGSAPGDDIIRAAADRAGTDPTAALQALAAADLIALDAHSRLVAAYPFSPTPTRHLVAVGPITVSAMCAIDALGIPYMLGTDAVIASTDPHSGQPVQVTVTNGEAIFEPAAAVVVYAATGTAGPSVDTCCTTINFFASSGTAHAWTAAHPAGIVIVLSQDQAIALGRHIFEILLT